MTGVGYTTGLLQKAVELHRAGRLDEAEACYRAVLAQDTQNADALNLLGLIVQSRGHKEDALRFFEKAIAAAPRLATAHFNRANVLVDLERTAEAASAYRKAIKINPAYADAQLNYGALLYRLGQIKEAVFAFRAMTTQCPADARGHFNLGRCLAERSDVAAAESALNKALTLKPNDQDALLTLAKLYADTNRVSLAIETITQAIAVDPQNAKALTNLGTYFTYADDHVAAISAYDDALKVDPTYLSAQVNRGLAKLATGQWAPGWDDNAVRAVSEGDFEFRKLDLSWPQWNGEPLTGKKIFIWGEQGLGDEILYASMVPEVATMAAGCVLGCSRRLVKLFQRSWPNIQVVDLEVMLQDISPWSFDYQTSVIDLGRWRRRGVSTFPNRGAYLSADPEAATALRARYLSGQPDGTRLIGFSWRSFAPHVGPQKTPPLQSWPKILSSLAGALGSEALGGPRKRLISLQYGPLADVAADLASLADVFGQSIVVDEGVSPADDLDRQAAQIQALDLVVTVSNTTAHLSGALGVPTWVVVPNGKARLWYWLKDGTYSPWYRSHRLLRP